MLQQAKYISAYKYFSYVIIFNVNRYVCICVYVFMYVGIYLYDHPAGDKEVVGGGGNGGWLMAATVMNVLLMVDADWFGCWFR